jgi:hypothetical protein
MNAEDPESEHETGNCSQFSFCWGGGQKGEWGLFPCKSGFCKRLTPYRSGKRGSCFSDNSLHALIARKISPIKSLDNPPEKGYPSFNSQTFQFSGQLSA